MATQLHRKRPRPGATVPPPLPQQPPAHANTTTSQQPRPYFGIRRHHHPHVDYPPDDASVVSATATDITESSFSLDGDDVSDLHSVTREVPPAPASTGGGGGGGDEAPSSSSSPDRKDDEEAPALSQKDQMQGVMQDNLELMLEIVLRIREDPGFARNIYKECPRLQHLLDQHPDLRPLFEDPKLVRINFEQVFVKAGGVLPEDKKNKSCLQRIVESPLFKVFKVLILFKKVMACFLGGGVAMAGAMFAGCFDPEGGHHHHHGHDHDHDHDGDDNDDMNDPNRDTKDALEKAAERMEDKETQERIHGICEEHDPQKLLEEIDQNPDLQALRESNPLCAELMSDTETMKILTDPENLRSLGQTAELVEMDFADPSWTPEMDLEMGGGGGTDVVDVGAPDVDPTAADGVGDHPVHEGGGAPSSDVVPDDSLAQEQGSALDVGADVDMDGFEDAQQDMEATADDTPDLEQEEGGQAEAEGQEDGAEGEGDEEEGDDEEGDDDDDEEEEEEEEMMEYEHGEEVDPNERKGGQRSSQSGARGSQKKPPPKQQQRNANQGGGSGAFFANLGAGITDMLAAELVGASVTEMTSTGTEQFEDLEAMEEAADDAGDAAENVEDAAMAMDSAADMIDAHGDAIDGLEDGLDGAEGATEDGVAETDKDGKKGAKMAGAAGGGAAAGGAAAGVASRGKEREAKGEEEEEEKKSRFGFMGNIVGSISTAVKEHVASSFLGDDLGEMLVEKVEEEEESEDDDDDSSKGSKDEDDDDDIEKGKKGKEEKSSSSRSLQQKDDRPQSRRSLFGRKPK